MARWYSSVVIRFVYQKYDGNQTESGHEGVEGKSPLPFLGADDKGCEQRAEVRRKNDERCPKIDLSRMFVKEEHVLDPHEPTLSVDQYCAFRDEE